MSCWSGKARGAVRVSSPSELLFPSSSTIKPHHAAAEMHLQCRTKARPPKPTLRRTLSLDTLVGPYLQGHWPKQPESPNLTCVNDKATQTPSSWTEETRGRRGGVGHKRSASWGSAEHLREVAKLRHSPQKRSRHAPPTAVYDRTHQPPPTIHIHAPGATQTVPLLPLSRLAPRLRRSVEGLNLELEGVFVSELPEEQHKILDVPDGHRAPVPVQRCSSGSQSDPSPGLLSPSQSPCPIADSDMIVCGRLDPSPSPPLYVADAPSSSPAPIRPTLSKESHQRAVRECASVKKRFLPAIVAPSSHPVQTPTKSTSLLMEALPSAQ